MQLQTLVATIEYIQRKITKYFILPYVNSSKRIAFFIFIYNAHSLLKKKLRFIIT